MSYNKIQSENSKTMVSYTSLFIILQVIGIVLVFNVYYWIIHFRGGFSFTEPKIIFNWHPLLMTISFIYLLANAILHYRTFRNYKKRNLKNQHVTIHGVIILLIILAGCAAFVSHVYASPPIPNFYSLHSWLGVLTIVLFLLQFISGLLSFLYPGISDECRQVVAPYHVFFGVSTFVLAVTTAVLGFSEKLIFTLDKEYKHFVVEGLYGNFIGVMCVIFGTLAVYLVTKTEYKRCPRLDYEPIP